MLITMGNLSNYLYTHTHTPSFLYFIDVDLLYKNIIVTKSSQYLLKKLVLKFLLKCFGLSK